MAMIDFKDKKIPEGYIPPDPPIVLKEGMSREEVFKWIEQELHKVYKSEKGYLFKEMSKQDIYEELWKYYNVYELFGIDPRDF